MAGRVRAVRQFVHDSDEVIRLLPVFYLINFINNLLLEIPRPGRTPDLFCDRVSWLTTDSLSMRYSHEYLLGLKYSVAPRRW